MPETLDKRLEEKIWKPRGTVFLENFTVEGNIEAEEIAERLGMLGERGAEAVSEEEFTEGISRLREICPTQKRVVSNLVTDAGLAVLARILANDTTYTGIVNYGAVGTSSTGVSGSQTQLVAEVKRKGVATRSRTGATVVLRFFFTKSDVNGTFEEFGTFIDGTASANTGQMFNRALTGGWVKSALEAMTVTQQFDLNPA